MPPRPLCGPLPLYGIGELYGFITRTAAAAEARRLVAAFDAGTPATRAERARLAAELAKRTALVDTVFVAVFAWMAFIAFVAMVFVALFIAVCTSGRVP